MKVIKTRQALINGEGMVRNDGLTIQRLYSRHHVSIAGRNRLVNEYLRSPNHYHQTYLKWLEHKLEVSEKVR